MNDLWSSNNPSPEFPDKTEYNLREDIQCLQEELKEMNDLPMFVTAPNTQPDTVKDTDFIIMEFVCAVNDTLPVSGEVSTNGDWVSAKFSGRRSLRGTVAKDADWKLAKRYSNMGEI